MGPWNYVNFMKVCEQQMETPQKSQNGNVLLDERTYLTYMRVVGVMD